MRLPDIAPFFLVTGLMFGGTVYNDSVTDLSNDWTNPTFLSFTTGSNVVMGSTGATDRDYFSFNVPAGNRILGINVLAGTMGGGTGVGFLAIGSGTSFLNPTTSNATLAASLLGYTLYGASDVGANILPRLAVSNTSTPPAQGFTSLGSGNFSIWIQEGAQGTFPYAFDIVLATPEPAALPLACAGLGTILLLAMRRRQSSRRH